MKKISILVFACSLISLQVCPFFGMNSKKEEINTDIKVSFKSEKTASLVSNFEYHEDVKFAIELLQNLADQQEHRKLTIEEMRLIFRIISFLFLQETDDYSKGIEIMFKNGKKLQVPYSAEFFATLLGHSNSDASSKEKAD